MSRKRKLRAADAELRRRRIRQDLGYGLHSLLQRAAGAFGAARPRYKLAACLCFKDSESYLREWIEFHRLVGFDHFFLYNNESSDGYLELLKPYIEGGWVTLVDWPGSRQQIPMYDHCLRTFGPRAEWIAFIDDDEFLFTCDGSPLLERLAEYEDSAGIQIPRWSFGDSGHTSRPPGLVIESYTHRTVRLHATGKCIVRPARVHSCASPHHFATRSGHVLVDEDHLPCGRKEMADPKAVRFRINHYETKSKEEEALKLLRGKPNKNRDFVPPSHTKKYRRRKGANEVPDTEILRFLEPLKKKMAEPLDSIRADPSQASVR